MPNSTEMLIESLALAGDSSFVDDELKLYNASQNWFIENQTKDLFSLNCDNSLLFATQG